ncbi:hypothetical protein DM860_017129 [Cuscuta australis]|uniref:Adenylosuccinate lyase PurB C-terminal domain-containing protein n=1 Tax=Cuscuta australis TaxID=267555 RepID=A0A328DAT3_9ASTE|nr:hypothetical protein DM860_017129 [Cuscuta australis]
MFPPLQAFVFALPHRDLTDTTALQNMGVGLGHSHIAYHNALQGITKLRVDEATLTEDLNQTWEVLAEPIQTAGDKQPHWCFSPKNRCPIWFYTIIKKQKSVTAARKSTGKNIIGAHCRVPLFLVVFSVVEHVHDRLPISSPFQEFCTPCWERGLTSLLLILSGCLGCTHLMRPLALILPFYLTNLILSLMSPHSGELTPVAMQCSIVG